MANKRPVKDKITYLISRMLRAESTIFGSGCGSLGAFEQHLPDIFVRSVEELAQGLVLRRIKLPHVEAPSLARENPADEHDLDYVDKLELLVHQLLDTGLESGQLLRIPPDQATLFLGGEPCRDTGSEFWGRCPIRVTRLGDVEPPRLPPFDGFHEGALKPCNVGHLAHHGASALRLAALHNLRLDTEGLEPQAEVGLDAEEGLTHEINAEILRMKFETRSWKSRP